MVVRQNSGYSLKGNVWIHKKKAGDVDQQGYPHGIHEEQRLHFACGKSKASRSENDRLVVNGGLCEFTGRVL